MIKKFLTIAPFLASAALFAQGEAVAKPAGREGNLTQTLIMIGLAIVFFYFILWRPEQKRRKKMDKQRAEMKKGDRVTAMGIIGTVDKIQDNSVILKMVDGSKIEVVKAAISEVQIAEVKVEEPTKTPST